MFIIFAKFEVQPWNAPVEISDHVIGNSSESCNTIVEDITSNIKRRDVNKSKELV